MFLDYGTLEFHWQFLEKSFIPPDIAKSFKKKYET